jgi:hypothetical protein
MMVNMKSIFKSGVGLGNLIEWLEPVIADTNWLFVTLDSNRDDFAVAQKYLSPQLQQDGMSFWWGKEGLWLPGSELKKAYWSELNKAYMPNSIIVSFSAAYIFAKDIKSCPKPGFNRTTDQEQFTAAQLNEAEREIIRLNALGYVADGCGLQCVLIDDRFDLFVRDNFST